MGKIEEHKGKKYLMVYNYMLGKLLDQIREKIGLDKFGDFKILMERDDILPDNIILKNVFALITQVISNDDHSFSQINLEQSLAVQCKSIV